MPSVRELGKEDWAAWDQLVAASPQGNVFMRSDWLQMLCETEPGLQLLHLGCFSDAGSLIGGLAMPYTVQCGLKLAAPVEFFYHNSVLLAPPQRRSTAAIVREQSHVVADLAGELARRLHYARSELHPAFRDVRMFLYAGWQVETVYTHIWRMTDTEQTWMSMTREKRRQIKAASRNYTFTVEGEQALDDFLALYRETMRKFYWWPSPEWEARFRCRFQWMRACDGCRLYTARTPEGALHAGVVALLSREDHTAYLWRLGSARVSAETGLVPALYWQAACDLAQEFEQVDLGGSPEVTLNTFKDYLGAEAAQHFVVSHRSSPRKLAALEQGMLLKDKLYSAGMQLRDRWQRK